MFSNLTLYYLNQLGIEPWINKKNSLKLRDKSNQPVKLVVLISSDLNNKAQTLFNRMMTYISVKNDELLIIKVLEQDFAENQARQWLSQIEKNTPRAILTLGIDINDLSAGLSSTYPIIQSFTLDYLLENPSYKKNIFHDLSALKKLV